jgi:hypothetical protein
VAAYRKLPLVSKLFFKGRKIMETKLAPQLYGRTRLPEKLGISQRAVDELLATKQIASLKIGKRRLVTEEAIARFIRQREAAAR